MIDRKQNNVTTDKRINETVSRSTFIARESLRTTYSAVMNNRQVSMDVNQLGDALQSENIYMGKKKRSAMSISRLDSFVIRPI
jgi:hypothetical protein